jgi:hypothetical protein
MPEAIKAIALVPSLFFRYFGLSGVGMVHSRLRIDFARKFGVH